MSKEPLNRRQTLLNMRWQTRVDGNGLGPERIPKQRVGGSNPLSRSRSIESNGFCDSAPPETGFQAALGAFLLNRRVGNCSPARQRVRGGGQALL